MIPPTIIPILREALAAHEIFRKLGFSADDIYIRPKPDRLFMTVIRGAEFNYDLGEHDVEVNSLISQWAAAAQWWNTGDEADRAELLNTSKIRREVVPLIAALHAKGFSVKRSDA